jgi:hypothetical protein
MFRNYFSYIMEISRLLKGAAYLGVITGISPGYHRDILLSSVEKKRRSFKRSMNNSRLTNG